MSQKVCPYSEPYNPVYCIEKTCATCTQFEDYLEKLRVKINDVEYALDELKDLLVLNERTAKKQRLFTAQVGAGS